MTQREFAAATGTHPNTVAKWEAGRTRVGTTAAILIALLRDLHTRKGGLKR